MEENILNILFEVDENVCWDDHLDEIQDGMKSFQDAPGRGEDPENYLTSILSIYWEVFHTHNVYQRRQKKLPQREDDENLLPCYDVGIFLVGFSTLPIVLSLAEIKPIEQIYLLYSRETEGMLSEISNRISVMLPGSTLNTLVGHSITSPDFALEIESSSDPVQTFKRIKEVIDKVGDKRIALDLTGGKKTMLGGGFTGGAILGIANSIRSSDCNMFYVDSLEYDPQTRAPTPGTEFLNHLENPYDIYNMPYIQQAEKLFENHNYEAAAVLWDSVDKKLDTYAERYGLENEHEAVQNNLYMADCYGYWDAFDYLNATDSKQKYGIQWDYNVKHTYDAIDVLDILSQVNDQQTLFAEEKRIIHYTVDRFQNAIRRMDSDRFEDAIVRFAQVVEILCLYRIYQIAADGYLTDEFHNPVKNECCLDIRWSISELIRFLFRKNWKYNQRYNIAHAEMRLDIENFSYRDTDKITDLIEVRNDFVHVNSNPEWEEMQDNTKELQKIAKKFLYNFYNIYYSGSGISFDDLLELHRFRNISE